MKGDDDLSWFKSKEFKQVTTLFIISRFVIFFLFSIFAIRDIFHANSITYCLHSIYDAFSFYDAQFYLRISIFGYAADKWYAFFPIFPILINLLAKLGLNHVFAGLLISNLANFGSSILFYKLLPENKRKIGLIFWLFSPIAIYTSVIYTEAPFVFFTLLTYKLYKDNKWFLAGITLGLATSTRNVGSMLFLAIFIDSIIKKIGFKNLFKMFSIATILASIYPIYNFLTMKSFIYFAQVQNTLWNRSSVLPFMSIYRDISRWNLYKPSSKVMIVLNIISLIVLIYFLIKNIRNKDNLLLNMYLVFGILAPLTSSYHNSQPGTTSMIRFIFALFPLYFYFPEDKHYQKFLILFVEMGLIILFAYARNIFLA